MVYFQNFIKTFLLFIFLGNSFADQIDYGLKAYKKGNCMGCHKWHGDGGPGYGGAAMSLRDTGLDKEQLITLIACGRPGTNMPYFHKKSYINDSCFGLKHEDFEGDVNNRPLKAKNYLNDRQIKAVTNFIISDLKGKKLSLEYCIKFFGKPTKSCDGL